MSVPHCEPHHTKSVCIGVFLKDASIQVAARVGGHEIGHGCCPADAIGTAALLGYLADWPSPLRLAVAAAGTATLGLALTLGAPIGREVFLVSAQGAAPDLARYAERAI